MKPIFKLGGIGVYIHWTFWVLVALYMFSATAQAGIAEGLYAMTFVLSVFACVLLHEFGHSIAAAYYRIRTLDITLFPFGGVARLENLPQKPIQELVIAVAGPAVNVIIAALLFVAISLTDGTAPSAQTGHAFALGAGFLDGLLIVNLFLVLFNMLPAFPMDGGRVLRSLLAMRTGHMRATEIAARVGRWMAMVFTIVAIVYGPFSLLLVAGFVFIAGTAELVQARLRAATGDLGASESAVPLPRYGSSKQYSWNFQSSTADTEHDRSKHRDYAAGDIIDAIEVREIKP